MKNAEAAKLFEEKVQQLRDEVERSSQETADARALATQLASELARIRRLAKLPVRDELTAIVAGADEADSGPKAPTAPAAETSAAAEAEVRPAALDERAQVEQPSAPPDNDPNDP